MTEHRTNDLNYGHLGDAVYEPKAREWAFNRELCISSYFQPIGDATEVVPRSINPTLPPYPNNRNRLPRLLRSNPELVPAVSTLRDHVDESSAVQNLLTAYDPAVGDLLAQGWAADVEVKASGRTIPILAVPGGEAGEELRLVQLGYVRQGWENDKGIWIKIPRFTGGETGWWTGDGSPLQQICFAPGPQDRSSWLAVRTFTSTTFFRPLYHRSPVTAKGDRIGTQRRHDASRVNANPLFSISTNDTFKAIHADVAFNPWYPMQFAIVDQEGTWGVFNAERQRSTIVPTLAGHGNLMLDASRNDPMGDGWARILWVADVNTIVVCGRRGLLLYDIKRAPPIPIPGPDLDIERSSDWILDVKRSTTGDDQFCILTSSRLFWLLVSSAMEEERLGGQRARIKILLSWRHYRDAEDTTLRMLMPKDDTAARVILHSSITNMATSFNLALDTTQNPPATSLSDPSEFNLFQHLAGMNLPVPEAASPLLTLLMQELDYHEAPHHEASHPGTETPGIQYRDRGIRFYLLNVLLRDMSVHHGLYYTASRTSPVADGTIPISGVVEAPQWTSRISSGAHKSAKYVEESFVVPNGMLDNDEDPDVFQLRFRTRLRDRRGSTATILDQQDRTVPHEMCYDYIVGASPNQGIDFLEALEKIHIGLTTKLTNGDMALQNVYEHCEPLSSVYSLEEASQALRSMFDSFKSKSINSSLSLSTGALASPLTLGFGSANMEELSFLAIYDYIIASWVTPLPANVPGKVRVAKEKLAKKIAAELYLASTGAMLVESVQNGEHGESLAYSANTQASTAGGTVNGLQREQSSSQIGPTSGSQVLKGLMHPPALQTQSSQSTQHTTQPEENDNRKPQVSDENSALSRLKHYTTFHTSLSPFPASLRNTLAHWSVGADPSTYNWEATKAALEGISDGEGRRVPPEALAKRQVTRHRNLEKQKRKREEGKHVDLGERAEKRNRLADGKSWNVGSVQRFGVDELAPRWGSQMLPEGIGRATQSSGLGSQSLLPASQVERGRFGAKPPADARAAAKRKKRVAGF